MSFTPINPELEARLDAYIDGMLAGSEKESFEREMAGNPVLRELYENQVRIDSMLKRQFAFDEQRAARTLPAAIDLVSAPPPAIPIGRGKSGTLARLKWYAAAAVVALAAVFGYRNYVNVTAPPSVHLLGPEEVYAKMEAKNFEPEFVCTTDAEFAATVKKKFGQPLLVATTPTMKLVGWGYGSAYSGRIVGDNTLVLITRVDDKPVLMFMDKKGDDRPLEVPPESPVHIFRREVGSMVLYEVTPLEQPVLLDRTYNPDRTKPPA